MPRDRAGVVLVADGRVLLVERRREGRLYYVCPGGGVEAGESFEQAAVREAREELGVGVALDGVALEVEFGGRQVYFRARVIDGEVGDAYFDAKEDAGTYRPAWLPLAGLAALDVRPPELTALLSGTTRSPPPSRPAPPT